MPTILPDPILQTARVELHILPDEFTVCQVTDVIQFARAGRLLSPAYAS